VSDLEFRVGSRVIKRRLSERDHAFIKMNIIVGFAVAIAMVVYRREARIVG
jgi:hypothetical protein